MTAKLFKEIQTLEILGKEITADQLGKIVDYKYVQLNRMKNGHVKVTKKISQRLKELDREFISETEHFKATLIIKKK